MTGAPGELVADEARRQRLVGPLPSLGDRLVRRGVESRFSAWRAHDDHWETADIRLPKLPLRRRPVEALDGSDQVAELLCTLLVLGAQVAEERMDPVRFEVDTEPVEEDQAGDVVAEAAGEDPRMDLAEGVADDDERWPLTRVGEERS